MLALAELQQRFLTALAHGDDQALLASIDGDAPQAAARFAIYRNNWRNNLCSALRIGFPVVERLVGAEFFGWMATQFIEKYPSRSGNLDHYGVELPPFIREFPPLAELPYLGDVAALEWLIDSVMQAPDADIDIDAQDVLPPHIRLLCSAYPIHRIWQVNQPDWAGEGGVALEEGGVNLLIHRRSDGDGRYELVLQPLSDSQLSAFS